MNVLELGKGSLLVPIDIPIILNCVGACYLHLLGRAIDIVTLCFHGTNSFHVISLYLPLHSLLDFLQLLLALVACLMGLSFIAYDGNVKSQQLVTQ